MCTCACSRKHSQREIAEEGDGQKITLSEACCRQYGTTEQNHDHATMTACRPPGTATPAQRRRRPMRVRHPTGAGHPSEPLEIPHPPSPRQRRPPLKQNMIGATGHHGSSRRECAAQREVPQPLCCGARTLLTLEGQEDACCRCVGVLARSLCHLSSHRRFCRR